MADNLVDGEDLDVILDLPENDFAWMTTKTAADEVCLLFTIKFTMDLAIVLSDL